MMFSVRTTSIIALLLTALTTMAADARFDTRIFNPNFRTLQVRTSSNEFAPPVIGLNSSEKIVVSFDEMSTDMRYMRYRLIHCNADWTQSELLDSEFTDGFNYAAIDDYGFSAGTFANYVHYRFALPNDDIPILVSGNYIVQVYPEDDEEDVLLQARFCVAEDLFSVRNYITSRTDIDYNREHQQLTVDISSKSQKIRNWQYDIRLVVSQNSRLDNQVVLSRPNLIGTSSATFEHNKALVFPAGNEFRRFECVATHYAGMHVESIIHYDPFYNVDLFVDQPRSDKPYIFDQTQFGHFKVRQSGVTDIDTNSDYVIVHFALETPQMYGGDIYLDGDFTQHQFTDANRMRYNPASGLYELSMMLKMGSYNYQYLWLPDGSTTALTGPIEGNHYQTVNEYLSLVYYRPVGQRYDRLGGFGIEFSGK